MPDFKIPEVDLSLFTSDALTSFAAQAIEAKNTIIAGRTADTITQEELDQAKAYSDFATLTIPAARAERDRKAREFSSLTTEAAVAEAEAAAVTAPDITEVQTDTEFAAKAKTIRVANLASNVDTDADSVADADSGPKTTMTFHAAPGGRFATDAEISTKDIAETLIRRNAGYKVRGIPGSGDLLATIKRAYPAEFHLGEGRADEDYQKALEFVSSESRLEGGSLLKATKLAQARAKADGEDSLVAAGGWCAPSETDYSICFQGTSDGLWSGPEITVNRGGVRHTTGLEWGTVYGGGNLATAAGTFPTGFFNLTETQVAAGSPTKNCVQVACPSFVDDRLGVTGICITSPILTNRAYPEAVDVFIRGAMVVHAHQLNALQIAAMVAGSTAVTLAGINPWAADGSVTSNLLGAVGMAIVDMKYRLRLERGATLEVVLPYWVLEQMRADLSRRLGYDLDGLGIADSQISSWFSQRGARVQFVYDWQDAASTVAGPTNLPGIAGNGITNLPTSVQFLVYPAGTWVRAVEDVITLNSVYDSTLLATNMVTQLFTEEGWTMLKMCPLSRVYTVPICPSGQTTAGALVSCINP